MKPLVNAVVCALLLVPTFAHAAIRSGNATGDVTLPIAIDDGGNSGTGSFDADSTTVTPSVMAVNNAPVVANPIPNQNATEDSAFNFQFAANTFNDGDVGDTLTYSAQLAGGGALPAWLSFDPVTRTFSGTPANAHVGTVSIDVIANDGNGGTVTDTFAIVVANSNDAPTVANPIPNQNATEDSAFNFQFAANTFNDADVGDTLTYSAQLAGGGALPAWLSFDPATRTFSGTPLNAHVGTVSIDVIAGDGNGGTVTDTFDILVANDAPTVSSVSSISGDSTYKVGDSVVMVVNFSEAVFLSTGTIQLMLETGTPDRGATYLAGSGSSSIYFNYTVQDGDISLDLDFTGTTALVANGDTIQSGSFIDANLTLPSPGAAGSIAANKDIVIDGVRPTASIVVADTALAAGETSTVTITFNEAVSGLAIGDFTVANGTLSGLSSGDGGVAWTATLTPTDSITDTTNLITLDNTGVADAAGNSGTGTTNSNNYAIDTQRPTASIVVADTALAAGETSTVTITFNEAVTGLAIGDFTVANGALSGLSSSDGDITWTATLTPTDDITDTTNLITLDNTGVADDAGNTGTGTTDSNNYAIDTLRPTASIVVADTALAAGETSTVTVTFSEAITGLAIGDFTVANGALSELSSDDGGISWTATLTPTDSITDTTNLITLDNTGVADATGSTGTGTTDSNSYAIDTLRPTASIVVADSTLVAGETSTVTITFNEAVSGLVAASFTVDNGTLSDPASSDGGITWTAILTTSTVAAAGNVITLDNSGVSDSAGNAGSGSSVSNSFDISPVLYTVGGTVTGLGSGLNLVLQLNGSDDELVVADGLFIFATGLANGAAYAISVSTQPIGQTCGVDNGNGVIAAADVSDVTVTCAPTELVAVVTPTTGLVTTEQGGSQTFTIVLAIRPAADVVIGLSSSDTAEGTVAPESVTFTSENWNVARTVTVTGVDDDLADGDQAFTILTSATSSADPVWEGLAIEDVTATNIDDETSADDGDGDGVPNEIEDGGPNGGDGDGDGILDSTQPNVVTLPAANGNGFITLSATCELRDVRAVAKESLPPTQLMFPFALVEFRLPCSSADVTALFHAGSGWEPGIGYWKYGPETPGQALTAKWYERDGTVLDTMTVAGVTVARARFTLIDGELGDDTGVEGQIIGQGGPAAPVPTHSIPTMSEWVMIMLAMVLAGVAVLRLR